MLEQQSHSWNKVKIESVIKEREDIKDHLETLELRIE